jgi:WD40 repeat protein
MIEDEGYINDSICTKFKDEAIIAGSCSGSNIRLWNANSAECMHVWKSPAIRLLPLTFNGEECILGAAKQEKEIHIWRLSDYQHIKSLKLENEIWKICNLEIHNVQIFITRDTSLYFWNLDDSKQPSKPIKKLFVEPTVYTFIPVVQNNSCYIVVREGSSDGSLSILKKSLI